MPCVALFALDATSARREIRRVLDEHDGELYKLLAPLLSVSEAERHAIGALDIAADATQAWEANGVALRALLPREPPITTALASNATMPAHASPADTPDFAYASAAMIVAHLVRDWSALGGRARERTHRPVLRAIRALQRSRRRPLTVLVPGAGACRLAWDIARLGNRVEANDVSAAMLVAARSVLSLGTRRLQLYPRVRCTSGAVRRAACLDAHSIPDIAPSNCEPLLRGPPTLASAAIALTMQVGSWAEMHTPPPVYGASRMANATFDAVVTCYFLDTQANPAAAVARVRSLLVPGGVWINVGPLQWHDPGAGLLRLTLDELLALLDLAGFQMRTLRRLRRVPYIGRYEPRRWLPIPSQWLSPWRRHWSLPPHRRQRRSQRGPLHIRRWEGFLGADEDAHDVLFWEATLAG